MAYITIVTDSNVCLPDAVAHELGIRVVPISIHLTDADGRDDTIDPKLVFDALARDETVKSSPPAAADYLTAIEDADGDEVLVLTPAIEFTTMASNARQAATLASKPVRVVDTRTATAAQSLVVRSAAEAARAGATLDAVEAVARDAARRVELVASLDATTAIEHSGRIPSPVLETVRERRAHPLFRFREGAVTPLEIEALDPLDALRAAWLADGGPGATQSTVFHAAAEERAQRLQRLLGGRADIVGFSPAMAVHTGPGVLGVAWLRAPN